MNPDDRCLRPATLPELEQLLVRAARRRARPRLGARRWTLAIAAASLLLAGGAAAAATGVLEIEGGETTDGSFRIEGEVTPPSRRVAHDDSVCLRLRFGDRGAAYGCGTRPSDRKPFGLVVADSLDMGGERVVYGLVAGEVERIRVLGGGGSRADAATREQAGLPGRYFSVVAPDDGQIELIAYDAGGEEVARLGSIEPPSEPPLSRAEAIAQGDPAGFAPTVPAPGVRGEEIIVPGPSTAGR